MAITFRPMRRFKQAASEQECTVLLKTAPRGVLSVLGDGGYPYGMPLNFIYEGGKIYFHCAMEGLKKEKYFPGGYDIEADMVKNAPRALVLALTIEHMSGKHVREK